MLLDQTKRLIAAAKARCSDMSIAPVFVVKGNLPLVTQGTFVAKPPVYAYDPVDRHFEKAGIERDLKQGFRRKPMRWLHRRSLHRRLHPVISLTGRVSALTAALTSWRYYVD